MRQENAEHAVKTALPLGEQEEKEQIIPSGGRKPPDLQLGNIAEEGLCGPGEKGERRGGGRIWDQQQVKLRRGKKGETVGVKAKYW